MGSSGSKKYPDEFGGALGERKFTKNSLANAVQDALDGNINPNWVRGVYNGYNTNCAITSTVFALKARGYDDIEAMPRDPSQWRGFDSVFNVDWGNPDNYVLNSSARGMSGVPYDFEITANTDLKYYEIPKMPRGANAVANRIESKMKKWGDGAIAVMSVKWKGANSAHAVNIVNQGGTIKLVDAQTRKSTTDIAGYLSATVANHTSIVRLDNAPILDPRDLGGLNKIVRRKKK